MLGSNKIKGRIKIPLLQSGSYPPQATFMVCVTHCTHEKRILPFFTVNPFHQSKSFMLLMILIKIYIE